MGQTKKLESQITKEYEKLYDHKPFEEFVIEVRKNIQKKYTNPKPLDLKEEIKKEACNIKEWISTDIGFRLASRVFIPTNELLEKLTKKTMEKSNLPYYDKKTIDEVIINWLKENGYKTKGYETGEGLGLTGYCERCNQYIVNENQKETGFVNEPFIGYGQYDEEKDEWICNECIEMEKNN